MKESKFGDDEEINEIVKVFDNRTKRTFRGEPEFVYIPFGRLRDKDPQYDIFGGKLRLSG